MGLGDWLRKMLGGRQPSLEMVPLLDAALPEQLQPGEVKHAEFDEGVRDYIRQIQTAFAEHRGLSFEEWEEGFRRDAKPEQEIAFWSYAADIYTACTAAESSPERRRDVYRCIVACMTTGPQGVWQVFRPEVLSQAEAEQVVNRFFGRDAEPDAAPDGGGM